MKDDGQAWGDVVPTSLRIALLQLNNLHLWPAKPFETVGCPRRHRDAVFILTITLHP